MGYGIMAFAVRIDRVERIFGSRDEQLIADFLLEFEREFADDETDIDDEEEPTLEEAFREMIAGDPLREAYGHKYGHLLELLCDHLGESLPNGQFCPIGSRGVEEVDLALTAAGVAEEAFSFRWNLMYRASPFKTPEPDDWPVIGHLKLVEIPRILGLLEAANLDAVDDEIRESLVQLKGWLSVCAGSDRDLVTFYH